MRRSESGKRQGSCSSARNRSDGTVSKSFLCQTRPMNCFILISAAIPRQFIFKMVHMINCKEIWKLCFCTMSFKLVCTTMTTNVSLMPISLYQKILLKILNSHLLLFSLTLFLLLLDSYYASICRALYNLSLYFLWEIPVLLIIVSRNQGWRGET